MRVDHGRVPWAHQAQLGIPRLRDLNLYSLGSEKLLEGSDREWRDHLCRMVMEQRKQGQVLQRLRAVCARQLRWC